MIGKIVGKRKNSGMLFILGEDKKRYVGFAHETDIKTKEGKTVSFRPGEPDTFPDGTKAKLLRAYDIQNNPVAKLFNDPMLRKAVTEYYEWHGSRRIHLYAIAVNKKSGYMLLHVHFIDSNEVRLSSLMTYQPWADGHYDVTEIDVCKREEEQEMIENFENSEEYV